MVRLARFGPLFEDLCVHSPTLISSPPDCIHQAVIQRPRELHHDLNRTLSSSFLTSILLSFLGSASFLPPHSRLCICLCTCYFSPPPISQSVYSHRHHSQHDSFRIQAPTHACCRSGLYEVLHLHLNQASGPRGIRQRRKTTGSVTEKRQRLVRKARRSCKDPISSKYAKEGTKTSIWC